MVKHKRDLVMFPDEGKYGFGPFTAHFVTYSKIDGTRKRDIDGYVWYIGTIVK